MKILSIIIALLVISTVCHAQITRQQFKPDFSIKIKTPKLKNYIEEPYFKLKQFTKPDAGLTNKKPEVSLQKQLPNSLKWKMPIAKPDSVIRFPMLAVRPDSTVRYHLRVKKVK